MCWNINIDRLRHEKIMATTFPFVVRVYGVYIEPDKGVLVSDEFIYNQQITKFPGGGLEFGEGTLECLKREMREEMDMEFEIGEHFYTTDFFVPSAFNSAIQVVSIYYRMKPSEPLKVELASKAFDFGVLKDGAQRFRFIPFDQLHDDSFSLVIDQKVGQMIAEQLSK